MLNGAAPLAFAAPLLNARGKGFRDACCVMLAKALVVPSRTTQYATPPPYADTLEDIIFASMSTSSLLAAIYDLGEQLRDAIEQRRIESAVALVQERDLLVQRLEAFDHPSEVDSEWKQWRSRFAAQHEALTHALAALNEHTMDTRRRVETLSQAHAQYRTSHASPSGVLHPDFSA